MKPINLSSYDFATLIEKGFVYVDKTAQIRDLVRDSEDCMYFLSRPRRFGKSLLLSTLKALFQGRRELFRGLAIDRLGWDWERETCPVLHLDMSVVAASTAPSLELKLSKLMELLCEDFGVPFDKGVDAAMNFNVLLRGLHKQSPTGKFVLLIDEYDAPVAGLLESEEGRGELGKIRSVLHDFYVNAKANCENIRLLMVTGVSKFAKLSIFSAFNNLVDLSMDERTAALLGYTHEEMESYFHEHIQAFADAREKSYSEAFRELLDWYDSYQFCPTRLVKVVNPLSLGYALTRKIIQNFWESTAGSTLIFNALKAANKSPADMKTAIGLSSLDYADALTAPTAALMYQGGYLTLDRPLDERRMLLRIPNYEVEQSLQMGYMRQILGRDFELNEFQLLAEDTAMEIAAEGVTENFVKLLKSAYSKLPHDWVCRDEREAKRYFLSFMVFARAEVAGEPQHATGRPDAVLTTAKGIYIFEFKYNRSAGEALEQCRQRNYASRFAGDARPVTYVGINYNPADNVRTVDGVCCEQAKACPSSLRS